MQKAGNWMQDKANKQNSGSIVRTAQTHEHTHLCNSSYDEVLMCTSQFDATLLKTLGRGDQDCTVKMIQKIAFLRREKIP